MDFKDQGGHLSFSLQLVKIPLFTIVLTLSPFAETPLSLGSFSGFPKIVLCILTLTSLPKNFSFFKSITAFEK